MVKKWSWCKGGNFNEVWYFFFVLDGEILFFYSGDNIDVFMLDIDILVGIVRKILGLRDKKCEGILNRIL